MSGPALPPIDSDLPGLLRQLQAALDARDAGAVAASLQAIGRARLILASTLAGAVAIGGAALAEGLVQAYAPTASDEQRAEALRLALAGLIELQPGGSTERREQVARWLIDGFGLSGDPDTLFDRLRIAFLAAHGPLEQLPEVLRACVQLQQWAPALQAMERTRAALGPALPRESYGLASVCLHHLGRYEEANRWMDEGLGADARLLAVPPVQTEAELLERWGDAAARPVVSIMCHAYNHERYIDTTIRGFLAQQCDYPFEILIYDDASTDRTADIVREWQRRYPTVIRSLLQTENQMSCQILRPYQQALQATRGDFVATCEGDDYWIDPHKLQRQVALLQARPELSCCAHNYLLLNEGTASIRPWSNVGHDFEVSQRQMQSTQMLIWTVTLVFRKTFSQLPAEGEYAPCGDQFLISYLGTFGPCAYLETMVSAVRRINEFSSWMPLQEAVKERRRVQTWVAMLRLHQRLGNADAVADIMAKVDNSKLDDAVKQELLEAHPPTAAATPAPAETTTGIKLVIWDLDDTFWRGTLAEGDELEIPPAHLEAVRELTRRGIVNTICSKNDFSAAQARLEQAGIWEHFVFPRIAFSPKGELIRDIVAQAQLRAENVLFIDDNPLNIEEARFYNPGIQVLEAGATGTLLAMPGLAGKPDGGKRLAQYKMLEQRSQERAGASSNEEFLRQSDIRLRITPTTADDAERVHDMIARTNQLNFTKQRLSADEVRALIEDAANETATVAVRDRFGDHGVVGWYCLRDGVLEHFLFSCRIINLGIEQYVYAHLGHPRLTVVGDVASTLSEQQPGADYITLETAPQALQQAESAQAPCAKVRIYASGACDMYYLVGTLANALTEVSFECNTFRGSTRGVNVATEYLRSCFEMSGDDKDFCAQHFHNYTGQTAFKTRIFDGGYDYALFSFNDDAELFTYRHRSRPGLRVVLSESAAYSVTPVLPPPGDDPDRWLCGQFDNLGLITPERFRENLLWIAERMPGHTRLLLMTLPEYDYFRDAIPSFPQYRRQCLRLNGVIRELCAGDGRFTLVEFNKHVTERSHFSDYVMHLRPERGFRLACEALQQMALHPARTGLAEQLPAGGRKIVLLGKGIETLPYFWALAAAGVEVSGCFVQESDIRLDSEPLPRLPAIAGQAQAFFAVVTPQLGGDGSILRGLGYADGKDHLVLPESVFNLDWKER